MAQKKIHFCPIVQDGHPALSARSEEIPVDQITSSEIQKVIADLKITMAGEPDGVAIAAPQIGINKRIFAVKGLVFGADQPDMAFINPVIVNKSKKKHIQDEGCLSVRYTYGAVPRHTNVTIQAYLEDGSKIERGAGGLLAHVFQHEVDHLDGVLFTKKAIELEHLNEEEQDHLDRQSQKRKDELNGETK